jgi:hypothetical protein
VLVPHAGPAHDRQTGHRGVGLADRKSPRRAPGRTMKSRNLTHTVQLGFSQVSRRSRLSGARETSCDQVRGAPR